MPELIRILYVDDNPHDRELVLDALEKESGGFQVTLTASRADFERQLEGGAYDLVLSDFNILGFEGLQVIDAVKARQPGLPVVIVTGTGSEEIAVEAMKRGAADYVIKSPNHIRRLPHMIRAELAKKLRADEHDRLKQERDRLFDYSIDLLCIAGFDGQFKQLNPAWNKLLGWSNVELLSRPLAAQVHPDDQDSTARALARLIHEQQPLAFENRYRCQDGSYKSLAWNAYPLPNEQLIFAVARDMTARVQAEAKIQRHLGQLAALRQIDQAIAATFDQRLALNILVEQAAEHLRVDIAEIWLVNPQSNQLEHGASHGRQPQTGSLAMDRSYAGRVVREGKIVHLRQLPNAPGGPARPGADTPTSYYGVPLVAKGKIRGVLEIIHRAPLELDSEGLEFLQALGSEAAIAIDNAQLFGGLQRANLELALAYDATMEGWARALDVRNQASAGHSQHEMELTGILGAAMGLDEAAVRQARRGALLHDIGLLGVPDAILLKPGPLDEAEWATVKRHPELAMEMLSSIGYLRAALDIPYGHHEKWDGSGYPRGLKGETIPLAARIFGVVDVWDALSSDRPYRARWPEQRARDYLLSQAGQQFDPKVVQVYLELRARGL